MRKLLLVTTALLALAVPASADTIVGTARVDGNLVATVNSANSSLNVVNQSFGSFFNLNSLTVNSQAGIAAPGILSTNTFNVNQTLGGVHDLVIDIVALGLVGTGSIAALLSTFSVSGLPDGWSIMEQTFINNNLLAATPVFTGVSDSASSIDLALLTNPFNAEVIYTIHSTGIGNLNGGIDISVTAAVPEPATWGMLLIGFAGMGLVAMRKRRQDTALRLV